jgi:hypothetical protein
MLAGMARLGTLTAARQRLASERARIARAAEPRARPPLPNDWKPTPTPAEANRMAATGLPVTIKAWDGSPIDLSSFDPSVPVPPTPPTNTALPSIVELTDLTVGAQLAGQQGTWTGSPTIARQWLRDGTAIAGATGAAYTMVADDLGSMVGLTVTATNAGGSASADAIPVGPVLPAARKARRSAAWRPGEPD